MYIIFALNPYLLNLIHKVSTFQGDGQFKRTLDPFNEYELVTYLPSSQRSKFKSVRLDLY
jgi:hypothetical protein